MTVNPAAVINRPAPSLAPGEAADLTVIDPNKRWTVKVDSFLCKSRNCPYDGWRLAGRAVATIVDGDVKYRL